ncbi:TonB-dependent receptor domain-containing protein [uncultured Bacteroides sp.]|uniref:TonB-dependent receptor plug domain-containing protein n=1 Tax=uncultured Bacteroides sp. TaxID=162156 RepID=UPI002AA66510|nr:TonB-dependent receptor [uncultured Bacteroides sp.]
MSKFDLLRTFSNVGIVSLLVLQPLCVFAQRQRIDTTRVYAIPEVMISERYQTREVQAAVPKQILTREEIKGLNVLQVSDAVKHFAGVTVKDYGGIGGLKTVSLRSLGAEHTAVSYDGIAVTDCQTGQIDIGRFSLDNIDRLSLSNGQADNIFQPARLFASAGILNIQTLTPQFIKEKDVNAYASFKTGSWGLINPAFRLEHKIGEHWATSFNSEWMSADGRYPYTLHYGAANDSTSHEKRKNTEVKTLRAEGELFGNFSNSEQWRLKAYYYQSSRGLPGATTLYYDYASQHLWDKNAFVQSHYKKELNKQWVWQTSAKWNWSYQRYLDPDYKGTTGKTENSYYQQEYYLSASMLYRMFNQLSISLSTDGSINTLNANLNNFARPLRYSWLTAIAGKYVNEWLTASASILATVINEHTEQGTSATNRRRLTPDISASIKPFAGEEFHIRLFYKNIFRLPSFNDLYYGETGNNNLLPEKATQYNLGLTYSKDISKLLPYVSATIDAYYNRVSDKIIATPTKNIFVWSTVNLGKVDIKGVDATARISLQVWEKIRFNLAGNYTYQQALDVTDPNSKTYKNQIAYTPRISGSGQLGIETPLVNLSYSLLFSGKRYMLGQNLSENRLESYKDSSFSVSKELKIDGTNALLSAEVLNLANKNYEIVKNFPMPGRSIRATIKITY